ncbi:MAG: hypothetical protein P1V51_02950 [Deltaproteobacteria bacterium]|nr:hypothetical protein [Deltaproteobacteria bacterium]
MTPRESQADSQLERARASACREIARQAHVFGTQPASLLAPQASGARHRLGVTEIDARFPFALGGGWRRVWEQALAELAYLYVARNRDVLEEGAYDRMMLRQESVMPDLPPVMLAPPAGVSQAALRECMAASAAILPGLDAGLLVAWWGSQGRGRPLLTEWSRLMARAAAEMRSTGGAEDTVVLVQWMCRFGFALVPRAVSGQGLDGAVAQEVQAALATALHLSHRVVLAGTAEKMGEALESRKQALARWRALVAPELALQAATARPGHAHFHAFTGEARPLIPDTLARIAALGEGQATADLIALLSGDRALKEAALQRISRHRLVRACTDALVCSLEPGGGALRRAVLQLRRRPEKLLPIVEDRKARGEWVKQLEAGAKALERREAQEAVLALARALKKARADRPPPVEGEDDPLREAAGAMILHAGGLEAARAAAGAVKRLDQRSGSESDRSLREEHAAGQLYLVELGEAPILDHTAEAAPVGHLFTDMKDFTRRTSDLKEAVTAEFLRTAFYGPILGIAREYFAGLTQLSDRGGVYLNNLLGDAVSLSGDVQSLVAIARRIREHLRAYEADIQKRLGAYDEATRSKAELAAGTFIAHGAPPSVVTFDDELWGGVRVSIAEKINESARGCARTAAVHTAITAELTFLQRVHQKPGLVLPFQVYVRRPDSLPLDPAQALALARARERGDRERYLEIYRIAAERQADAALTGGDEEDALEASVGALYNAGEAISGEALQAYREQVGATGAISEARIEVRHLEKALLDRFAFLEPELRLCLILDRQGRPSLFRHAGRVRFKGLEAGPPTEIWELVDLQSAAGQALWGSPRVRKLLG